MLKGHAMNGATRGRKPPLEVKREFMASRLETQVLTQMYELIVPVIRRPTPTARTLWDLIDGQADKSHFTRMAKGA